MIQSIFGEEQNNMSKIQSGIYIVGTGVKTIAHITLETEKLLHNADFAVYLDETGEIEHYLRTINLKGNNIIGLYKDGAIRSDIYDQIVNNIIDVAESNRRVVYLAPGNPIFLNSVVERLLNLCEQQNKNVFLLSGVSSVDTVLTDLRMPVQRTGIQCYDSTFLLENKPFIDTKVPLLIFQPGVVNNREIKLRTPPDITDIVRLKDELISRYVEDSRWILVSSAARFGKPPTIWSGVLRELDSYYAQMLFGTLVIPGNWWPKGIFDDHDRRVGEIYAEGN